MGWCPERVDRRAVGAAGEDAAAELLETLGYRVLARNVRCVWGEIDLVVERGELVCIVEVRTRSTSSWGDPSQTVSWAKQQRVVKTAMRFVAAERLNGRPIRFDVVSVTGPPGNRSVRHIPNAFEAGF